jgi:hypothetical protein
METLEEFAKKQSKEDTKELIENNKEGCDIINPSYEDVCNAELYGIELGAKWQQERMYSDVELAKAYDLGVEQGVKRGVYERAICDWDEIKNQFKK